MWACDSCGTDQVDELYEGWFKTQAAYNPWLQGTATAGLLQRRLVCLDCLIKSGRKPAEAEEAESNS